MTGKDPRWDDPDAEILEFVIRGDDAPDFAIYEDDIPRALRPDVRPSRLRPGFDIDGHYEIEVEACIIDFSPDRCPFQKVSCSS